MEQLAPHEKLFVDKSFLTDDPVHGSMECQECHGGNPRDKAWQTAHVSLVRDPSKDKLSETCGVCHSDIAETFQTSLHATLEPYVKVIDLRSTRDKAKYETMSGARQDHCLTCHASCGQCHISRPASVQGGLLDSHIFKKKPPMRETCAACHGSRVDREFFGKNAGIPSDVHRQKYMTCTDCHTGTEMHGDGNKYDSRYDVKTAPKCADCHEEIYTPVRANSSQHLTHQDKVSCQVCHAAEYKNCFSCHVGKDSKGLAYFKTEPSEMGFKIGINPALSERHPEKFVTVRHIPIDQGLFSFYLPGALENFDAVPTWKMATPHTIQKKTPQNQSCDSCHGQSDLFLLEGDVRPAYRKANKNVIVQLEMLPARIAE